MLTDSEKVAGRKFRSEVEAWLAMKIEEEQPYYRVPPYLAYYRHVCPAVGKSVSLALTEQYVVSPEQRVAFVYRQGKCAKCRRVAMSDTGRIVDAYERPSRGRVRQWK